MINILASITLVSILLELPLAIICIKYQTSQVISHIQSPQSRHDEMVSVLTKWAYLARFQPSTDAVEVESMVADTYQATSK